MVVLPSGVRTGVDHGFPPKTKPFWRPSSPHGLCQTPQSGPRDTNTTESHPCYLVLPSLNSPGSRVILCAGAFVRSKSTSLIEREILVSGLIDAPLSLNCTQEELSLINGFVSDYRSGNGPSGLWFSGCSQVFNDNRIEGRLLAMAARLRFSNRESRLLLAAEVAALLSARKHQQLLQSEYLIIPDLQMWPAAYGCDRLITYRLHKEFSDRERATASPHRCLYRRPPRTWTGVRLFVRILLSPREFSEGHSCLPLCFDAVPFKGHLSGSSINCKWVLTPCPSSFMELRNRFLFELVEEEPSTRR